MRDNTRDFGSVGDDQPQHLRKYDGLTNGMNLLRAITVTCVAVYLIPEGAHFFEMFSKFALPSDAYMMVQRIYDGWAFFGIVIVLALIGTLAHAIATWRYPLVRWLSLGSFAALAATQVIFWSLIYPMNVLTRNWIETPNNLDAVRSQWEFAHAASAGLTLLALWLVLYAISAGIRAEASGSAARHREVCHALITAPCPVVATQIVPEI
jgi:hypothetical protein